MNTEYVTRAYQELSVLAEMALVSLTFRCTVRAHSCKGTQILIRHFLRYHVLRISNSKNDASLYGVEAKVNGALCY